MELENDPLLRVIRESWGYTELRPLQREAMEAALRRRDSLVVLPTGGGKSLCYQAPALLADGVTVVVSPLISLMKDQVDRLIGRGVPTAFLNSSLEWEDRRRVSGDLARGRYKLIFVAPERFTGERFLASLDSVGVAAFAIDEAHCISHWGHDFRVDYRRLDQLKKRFPDTPVHAFTATATPRVRQDVITHLELKDPVVLVGDFFRPNLSYRVERRTDAFDDVQGEIRGRSGQAGLVYCIRRADVDDLAAQLKRSGIRVAAYHAGMSDEERTRVQDQFTAAEVDVVVATVAFGMGIDRADIRFVIHAAMPKSLEHYQQETGRAGRDGKPADCVLFYSGADYGLWRTLLTQHEPADVDHKMRMLSEIYAFCTGARCRHRSLVEYFGQAWRRESCGACDVCKGQRAALTDGARLARAIVDGIMRTGQRFGPAYVADVLSGQVTDRVTERGHRDLAAFGALAEHPKGALIAWMSQLVDQGVLVRDGEYGVLKLTMSGWKVARGEAQATLREVDRGRSTKKSRRRKELGVPAKVEEDVPGGPGSVLFEELRALRRSIADEEGVPAFMVFSDKTLRLMARAKPSTRSELLDIHGVGPTKVERYGARFLKLIQMRGEGD